MDWASQTLDDENVPTSDVRRFERHSADANVDIDSRAWHRSSVSSAQHNSVHYHAEWKAPAAAPQTHVRPMKYSDAARETPFAKFHERTLLAETRKELPYAKCSRQVPFAPVCEHSSAAILVSAEVDFVDTEFKH